MNNPTETNSIEQISLARNVDRSKMVAPTPQSKRSITRRQSGEKRSEEAGTEEMDPTSATKETSMGDATT